MSPEQIEAMAAAARKVVLQHINRIAGQQLRRMFESWRKTS